MTPRGISSRNGRVVSNAVIQVSTLSLVAAFDELCRNGSVLQEHSETQFISHIRAAAEWRKKCKLSEAEKGRLNTLLIEKDKELAGKDYQIRQARKFVEEEVSYSQIIRLIDMLKLLFYWGALRIRPFQLF